MFLLHLASLLSIVFLRFFHVTICSCSLFIPIAVQYSIVCVYQYLSFQLLVDICILSSFGLLKTTLLEHHYTYLLVHMCLHLYSVQTQKQNCWAIGMHIFNFTGQCPTVFQTDCTNQDLYLHYSINRLNIVYIKAEHSLELSLFQVFSWGYKDKIQEIKLQDQEGEMGKKLKVLLVQNHVSQK